MLLIILYIIEMPKLLIKIIREKTIKNIVLVDFYVQIV